MSILIRYHVYAEGHWGSICRAGWTGKNSQVVCRQLGLSGGTQTVASSYGSGNGPVWLDRVNCQGNETRIETCPREGKGKWSLVTEECEDHKNDVGVVCGKYSVQYNRSCTLRYFSISDQHGTFRLSPCSSLAVH